MESWRDELYHHGILGQKWGVRRYQNPDGTLTEAGRRRIVKKAEKEYRRSKDLKPVDQDVSARKVAAELHKTKHYEDLKNSEELRRFSSTQKRRNALEDRVWNDAANEYVKKNRLKNIEDDIDNAYSYADTKVYKFFKSDAAAKALDDDFWSTNKAVVDKSKSIVEDILRDANVDDKFKRNVEREFRYPLPWLRPSHP